MDREPSVGRIVLADGDDGVRHNVAHFLSNLGYRVDSVSNAGEMLSVLAKERHEIAVIDCSLAEADGLAILDRVRQSSSGTAVVMMMGNPNVETVISAFRKGTFDFLIKPFEAGEIKQVIERAIDQLRKNEASSGQLADPMPR